MSKDILEEALELYGEDLQLQLVIEECSELIEVVSKYLRAKRYNERFSNPNFQNQTILKNKIPEEIADVQIMLKQLVMMLYCDEEVEMAKDIKLRRLKENIRFEKMSLGVLNEHKHQRSHP